MLFLFLISLSILRPYIVDLGYDVPKKVVIKAG